MTLALEPGRSTSFTPKIWFNRIERRILDPLGALG
jgi:hypothetical protein